MPPAARPLLVSAAMTALAVAVGVSITTDDHPHTPPSAGTPQPPAAVGTPLADLETGGLAVERASFCAGVAGGTVQQALGASPTRTTTWHNGETAPVTPRLEDVAHEFGCSWSAGTTAARGWVFAPPVDRRRAAELAEGAAAGAGCAPLADPPEFGTAGTALVCERGDVREASYRGLFGDAWLVCTLAAPTRVGRADLVERADRWCAAVVTAATGSTAAG